MPWALQHRLRCLALVKGFFTAIDIRKEGLIRLEDLVWFLDDAALKAAESSFESSEH